VQYITLKQKTVRQCSLMNNAKQLKFDTDVMYVLMNYNKF